MHCWNARISLSAKVDGLSRPRGTLKDFLPVHSVRICTFSGSEVKIISCITSFCKCNIHKSTLQPTNPSFCVTNCVEVCGYVCVCFTSQK